MTKQEKADVKRIADHYGLDVEYDKLIEEMDELKEAMETWGGGSRNVSEGEALDGMAEETADVEICLHHIKHLMGKEFRAQVADYRKQKIARQLERMEAGE